jgi:uncharacterized membrane protein YhaH (DUF805 family)
MSGKVEGHKGPGRFSFHGRAGRGEWLRIMAVSTILGAIATALSPAAGIVLSVPFTLMLLAVSSRRLHDLQLSGWLQTIPMAVMLADVGLFFAFQQFGLADFKPMLGGSLSATGVMNLPTKLQDLGSVTLTQWIPIGLWIVAMLGYLVLYGVLIFRSGDGGPNVYGEADKRL